MLRPWKEKLIQGSIIIVKAGREWKSFIFQFQTLLFSEVISKRTPSPQKPTMLVLFKNLYSSRHLSEVWI